MININILIALGNKLFSEALKELMSKCGCRYTIGVYFPANGSFSTDCEAYDVILTDYLTLSKIPRECFEKSRVLVMDNGLEKDTIVSMFVTDSIRGIVNADIDMPMLLKAISVVHSNEVWIDNNTVKSLLNKNLPRKIQKQPKITEREMAIVKILREGYRNKEIATLLSISEQTVKSHLNRIFRKMHVSGRTELLSKLSNNNDVDFK